MGWDKGVDNAKCDGCEYKAFSVNSETDEFWHDETRIKSGGIKDTFLLCGVCHDKYQTFLKKQEEDYTMFMRSLK